MFLKEVCYLITLIVFQVIIKETADEEVQTEPVDTWRYQISPAFKFLLKKHTTFKIWLKILSVGGLDLCLFDSDGHLMCLTNKLQLAPHVHGIYKTGAQFHKAYATFNALTFHVNQYYRYYFNVGVMWRQCCIFLKLSHVPCGWVVPRTGYFITGWLNVLHLLVTDCVTSIVLS